MSNTTPPNNTIPSSAVEEADEEGPGSIFSEFVYFIRTNKKWWLIPLIAIFLLLGLLIVLAGNPITSPFIYSLM